MKISCPFPIVLPLLGVLFACGGVRQQGHEIPPPHRRTPQHQNALSSPNSPRPQVFVVEGKRTVVADPNSAGEALASLGTHDMVLVRGEPQNQFQRVVGYLALKNLVSVEPVWVHKSQLFCGAWGGVCLVWSPDGFSNGRAQGGFNATVVRTLASGGIARTSGTNGDWVRVIGFGTPTPIQGWVAQDKTAFGNSALPYAPVAGGWKQEWNVFVADAIDAIGAPLVQSTTLPRDMPTLCPQFFQANKEEKKMVWALIFASMANFESSFNPRAVFNEPPPLNIPSMGLLQLSYGDNAHKGCRINKALGNAFDPQINLECGVAIMVNQMRVRGTLFTDRYYYWSVLTNKKAEIRAFFRKYGAPLNSVCGSF